MINVSIRKMRIFLATVEERNFTRAAMRQNISQPAATIVINQIEEEIGAQLFERRGNVRKAELTERGQAVADTFSRIVAGYDSEILSIEESDAGKHVERKLLLQSTLAKAVEPSWFTAVLNLLEGDKFSVEEHPKASLMDQIYARKANLGLVFGDVDQERADYFPLVEYSLVLLAPKGSIKKDPAEPYIRVESIPKISCYLMDCSPAITRSFRNAMQSAGRSPARLHESNSLSTLRLMIQAKECCGILPSVLVGDLSKDLALESHELGPDTFRGSIGIVTPWGFMNQIDRARLRNETLFEGSA